MLWAAIAVLAFIIFYFWNVHADFLGVVETRTHKLGPQDPGRIRELFVSLGEEVTAGQLLVQLDPGDLETEQAGLQAELTRQENLVAVDRRRYAQALGKSRGEAAADPGPADGAVDSMLGPRLEQIAELKLKLEMIRNRMDRRRVIAPCAGRVVNLNYLPGDAVESFATILTVEEPQAAFLDVYIPESSDVQPRLGQRVAVYPHRRGMAKTGGTIVFIDPGYSAIPPRLAFRNLTYWARKFRVRLDPDHHLMPGEAARIELLRNGTVLPKALATAAPPAAVPAAPARTRDQLSEFRIPPELRKLSRFEPSGLAWLADLERYVIVSDDTSRGRTEHSPWVFLSDREGKIEPQPSELKGTAKANDLESIAPGPDGFLYLVASQSLSKKGRRPESRQQIIKISRRVRDFRAVGAVDFLSAVTSSLNPEQLRRLGLGETSPDGQLVLNIEGAAWFQGELLLGLKAPRPPQGALIWRLHQPDRLIERQALDPDQLTLFGHADLRTPDGRPAAISDLFVNERGELLALSTVPGASPPEQAGGLHRLSPNGSDPFPAVTLFSFPGLKPEGLSSPGPGLLTVVFDTDDTLPVFFITLEAPSS